MPEQSFGGSWTDEKIDLLRRYLEFYCTALKKQSFRLMYIDAFAGIGGRSVRGPDPDLGRLPGLPEIDDFVHGSARVALEIDDRPFDTLAFIEKDTRRFEVLRRLGQEYPDRENAIRFLNADANEAVQEICRNTDWQSTRAVAFLDPFGMQVSWQTIEAIAATKAIDLWYLFPTGMGVGRMTPRSGDVPDAWAQRLDICCGDPGWRQVVYEQDPQRALFDDDGSGVQKSASLEAIERYILDRLRTCFAGAGKRGWRLYHGNTWMYSLVFAVGNPAPKAVGLALRAANYLIDEKHRLK